MVKNTLLQTAFSAILPLE